MSILGTAAFQEVEILRVAYRLRRSTITTGGASIQLAIWAVGEELFALALTLLTSFLFKGELQATAFASTQR